jgi:hypothetical protein
MMRYFGIYALLALVMCALNDTQAQAQQVVTPANSAFFGLCEKVSFTNLDGAEGLKNTTKLDQSIQYIASGDYDELTLIPSSAIIYDCPLCRF